MAPALCLLFLKKRPGLWPTVQAPARMLLACRSEIGDAGHWQAGRPGHSVLDSMYLPPLCQSSSFKGPTQTTLSHTQCALLKSPASKPSRLVKFRCSIGKQAQGAPRYTQTGMDIADPESS